MRKQAALVSAFSRSLINSKASVDGMETDMAFKKYGSSKRRKPRLRSVWRNPAIASLALPCHAGAKRSNASRAATKTPAKSTE